MKMNIDNDIFTHKSLPVFLEEAREILDYMQGLGYDKLKALWKCSDKLARLNYNYIMNMDLESNLTPALLAFEGIQYKYMAPSIFSYDELDYIENHLRILSGFYGILRPFDGVSPYRLEMKSRFSDWTYPTLYNFWDKKLAEELSREANYIIDLASKEYSQAIKSHLPKDIPLIKCIFGELIDQKVVEKGVFVKMARGEMVRYMAEENIKDLEKLKKFNRLNYSYKDELSNNESYVFIKN